MNNIAETEVKDIVYYEVRQHFTEENNTLGTIKDDYFRTGEKHERVIYNSNATVVILDDGSKGIAKCSPTDTFNKTQGVKIAYLRAKIKSLQKELKSLAK